MDALDFIVDRDQHMRPLEYDLSENFNELLRYMQDIGVLGNVPTGVTSESEIVSISDAYAAPPMALTVDGASTQDGTPTPDVPVPILSVDELSVQLQNGPNMLDTSEWEEDKYIGESGSIGSENGAHYSSNFSRVMSGTYTFNMHRSSTNNSRVRLHGYDKNHTWVLQLYTDVINSGTGWYSASVTIPSSVKYVRVSCRSTMTELQLELGSTATAYEPYVGTTVPDLLPDGTSLRSLPDGTKDQLNLAYLRPSTRDGWAWYSRELVQAVDEADLGDMTWTAYTISGHQIFRAPKIASSNSGICTSLVCVTNGASTIADNSINLLSLYWSTNGHVVARADAYANAAAFQSGMTGQKLVYKLATPVTTQLDPIELPQLPAPTATVWCDGGSVQPTLVLEYVRDANAVVAELSEAIADIISG